jgi:predicted DNA-binding transcriptional regulator AlpA
MAHESLLSMAEARLRLGGISETLVRKAMRQKDDPLPFIKIGRLTKFIPASLDAWIGRQERTFLPAPAKRIIRLHPLLR